MSLSQKHTGKVFVPWFNTAEWRELHDILCLHAYKNYYKALKMLKIWKQRTPLLSAGVEGTLILLEALLTEKEILLDYQLTQIYAISIMRFLNLCATNNEKQGTFYKTAEKNDLPRWLINIRHDIAHDHKLPSISILELSLCECLEWIKIKYWKIQNKAISDFTVMSVTKNQKVIEILKIYVQLNLKLYSKDVDMSDYDDDIIRKIDDIIFKMSCQPTTDILDIISVLEDFFTEKLSKLMYHSDIENVAKICVYEGLLDTETEKAPEGTCKIPKECRNLWSNLLDILNKNGIIPAVLHQLIDVTNNMNCKNITREKAALWISEIVLGLRKLQLVEELSILSENDPGQMNKRSMDRIYLVLEEKYPEYEDCLDFTFVATLPDLGHFEDKMVNMPSDFTLLFLEKSLRFNKRSEDYITDVINLVKKLVLITDKHEHEEVFTIHHLKNLNSSPVSTEDMDSDRSTVVIKIHDRNSQSTRWKLVPDTSLYKGCPLGILPQQNRTKNPVGIF